MNSGSSELGRMFPGISSSRFVSIGNSWIRFILGKEGYRLQFEPRGTLGSDGTGVALQKW